jgi:hypothetical protein
VKSYFCSPLQQWPQTYLPGPNNTARNRRKTWLRKWSGLPSLKQIVSFHQCLLSPNIKFTALPRFFFSLSPFWSMVKVFQLATKIWEWHFKREVQITYIIVYPKSTSDDATSNRPCTCGRDLATRLVIVQSAKLYYKMFAEMFANNVDTVVTLFMSPGPK